MPANTKQNIQKISIQPFASGLACKFPDQCKGLTLKHVIHLYMSFRIIARGEQRKPAAFVWLTVASGESTGQKEKTGATEMMTKAGAAGGILLILKCGFVGAVCLPQDWPNMKHTLGIQGKRE